MKPHMPNILGLAGVASSETLAARRAAKLLEWPMMFMAIWIILEWYLESVYGRLFSSRFTDWLIWGFFLSETLLLSYLVDNTRAYLRGNWINVLIIIFGCPIVWEIFPHAAGLRALRLVIMFTLFIHMSATAKRILSRHHLGSTLIASFFIIIMAGTIMSVIDPNVDTPFDGIWWAWVTVTTVGYGDIVPGSTVGRLFGSILILMGFALATLLTASFAAFFMAEEEKDMLDAEAENIKKLAIIETRLMTLESKLDALLKMEQRLARQDDQRQDSGHIAQQDPQQDDEPPEPTSQSPK